MSASEKEPAAFSARTYILLHGYYLNITGSRTTMKYAVRVHLAAMYCTATVATISIMGGIAATPSLFSP